MIALLLAGAALALAPPARADSVQERFAAAKLQFEYKNFEQAVEALGPLLSPTVLLTREEDIVEAREMLGLALFYLGKEAAARDEFVELLYLRPGHRLDAFLVPPPAVQFFEAIRNEPAMKEKLDQIERERREAAERARQAEKPPTEIRRIYLHRETEVHHRALAFMPFGIGQFQNHHDVKGHVLLWSELALLAGYGSCVITLLALRDDNYDFEKTELAQGAYVGQFVFGGLFLGAVVYGIVDANVYYEPELKRPFEAVREELEEARPEAPKKPAAGGAQIAPFVQPGGAGLQLQLRFD
ncbi:MAG: hypothetical protein JXR96_05260 [Deltaproteobacteria bacterium]|nr:hypothetical protein [Deltaproteobacteria bacterium]